MSASGNAAEPPWTTFLYNKPRKSSEPAKPVFRLGTKRVDNAISICNHAVKMSLSSTVKQTNQES